MKKAPIPKNEKERIKAVRKIKLLDTAPETRFDRITKLASRLLGTPISTLTLVDTNREWFKSVCGLSQNEGERAISFCGHAMLADGLFIIPDTKKDKRFADNPMVVGKPYIRFYAGVPIFSADGHRIGTFCVKDHRPRTLSKNDIELLKALAAWSQAEINLHNVDVALQTVQKMEKQHAQIMKKKLEQRENKKRYEFISMISHQLRTPVSSARFVLEMMQEEKSSESLRKAYQKIVSLNDIIGTLLFFIENGDHMESFGTYQPDCVNINNALRGQMQLLEQYCVGKKITVSWNVPTESVVWCNPIVLNRILYSVLENAIMYNRESGLVTISAKTDATHVIVTVQDTGYGVPAKEKKKIFSKYFRATNASLGNNEGSGLSLYIAYTLIKMFAGNVRFDTVEGVGSTVTLFFSQPSVPTKKKK